ncbi:MAG: hypothetical protein ABSC03_02065 [Verrucomicrobiota bacterium]|jgi:hypothetical protein
MNPSHALFVVDKPSNQVPDAEGKWELFLHHIGEIEHMKSGTEQLAENVWLIPVHTGIAGLSLLIQSALHKSQHEPLRYRLLFLNDPQWIDSGKQVASS